MTQGQPPKPAAPTSQVRAIEAQRRARWEEFHVAADDERSTLSVKLAKFLKASTAGLEPDFWRAVLLNVVREQPELVTECEPTSFLAAIETTAQLGLMPDKRSGHVYMLPFMDNKAGFKKVQFILGYKGIIELASRAKGVQGVIAETVHAGDEFDWELGLHPDIKHKPARTEKRNREIEYAYAICTFKDRPPVFKVVDKGEIEMARQRSRAKNAGPWVTDYAAMAAKTAVRRLEPWIPLDNPIRRQLQQQFAEEDDDGPRDVAAEGVTTASFGAAIAQRMARQATPALPASPIAEQLERERAEVHEIETQRPPPEPRQVPVDAPTHEPIQGREPGSDDDVHDDSPIAQFFNEPQRAREPEPDPVRRQRRPR